MPDTAEVNLGVYLDANILTSFLENENDTISELLSFLKKNNIKIYFSPFTMMEVLDIKHEHKYFHKKVAEGVPLKHIISKRRERDLTDEELANVFEETKRKLKTYDLEWFYYPLNAGWWKTALDIITDSNVTSSDALHLGQAINMGVNRLITSDKQFRDEGNKYLKEKFNGKYEDFILLPKEALTIFKEGL